MIEREIHNVSIGTGLTEVYLRTSGRKAVVKELTLTNTGTAVRTVDFYDGDTTTGITPLVRVILGAQETFTPKEAMYREVVRKDLVAICLEGTEVSVSGSVLEE